MRQSQKRGFPGQEGRSNACSGANGREFDAQDGRAGSPHMVTCPVCLRQALPSRSGSPRRFCSPECRWMSWALRRLAKASWEGRVPGLYLEMRAVFEEVPRKGFEEARRLMG